MASSCQSKLTASFFIPVPQHQKGERATLLVLLLSVYVSLSKNSLISTSGHFLSRKRMQRYKQFPNRENFLGIIFHGKQTFSRLFTKVTFLYIIYKYKGRIHSENAFQEGAHYLIEMMADSTFFSLLKNYRKKIWRNEKKFVPLHPHLRESALFGLFRGKFG